MMNATVFFFMVVVFSLLLGCTKKMGGAKGLTEHAHQFGSHQPLTPEQKLAMPKPLRVVGQVNVVYIAKDLARLSHPFV